jgi:hypothetical protein
MVTKEACLSGLVTPAKAGVHHEPLSKGGLCGAEDRDRLL